MQVVYRFPSYGKLRMPCEMATGIAVVVIINQVSQMALQQRLCGQHRRMLVAVLAKKKGGVDGEEEFMEVVKSSSVWWDEKERNEFNYRFELRKCDATTSNQDIHPGANIRHTTCASLSTARISPDPQLLQSGLDLYTITSCHKNHPLTSLRCARCAVTCW